MAGTATTEYALDTQGGLVERLGAATTTGGTTTSAWYVRGWGGELARQTGGGVAWYLADRLGRGTHRSGSRAEYDATPTVGARTDYDPFGQPEAGTGLVAPTDYGFAGEPQDGTTGQIHLRARWYQPGNGQFASRDPWAGDLATPQTLGPYAYAHDDPVNGTDPTGMFACAEHMAGSRGQAYPSAYAKDCEIKKQRLLADPAYRMQRQTDALGALIRLFTEQDLPGNSATERLDFVLWLTEDAPYAHFAVDFTDSGFAEELQDSHLWQDRNFDFGRGPVQFSNQVGHFLTAVRIGRDARNVPPIGVGLDCMIGHELIGDHKQTGNPIANVLGGLKTTGHQCLGTLLRPEFRGYFLEAVDLDLAGDCAERDHKLLLIDASLPGQAGASNPPNPNRQGNSLQDFRLTVRGYIFGLEVESGKIATRGQAAEWLTRHLRPNAGRGPVDGPH